MTRKQELESHQRALLSCEQCPDMIPPSVCCAPVLSSILLVGQAPGIKEPELKRPFAWTAGKTLFKWFASIGLEEDAFRRRVYMSAVCRCFPGKNPKGGDRVPSEQEIETCSQWINREIELLQPKLLIPVGKLAIMQYMSCNRLVDVVGSKHRMEIHGRKMDVVPLPHPSGASTWHRMQPGKQLLQDALDIIEAHPAWRKVIR